MIDNSLVLKRFALAFIRPVHWVTRSHEPPNVWVVDEFAANAKGGTMFGADVDSAYITKGFTAFAQLSYRLWAPDSPAATPSKLYHK